jgi:hypothetical protein
MPDEPLFLGRAKGITIDTTADRQFLRFQVNLPESPQLSPIQFVLSAPLAMQTLAALSDLQKKNDWKMPASLVQ